MATKKKSTKKAVSTKKPKTAKFKSLKVGDTFYANGGNGYEQYKKVSDLSYESVQNQILGEFYTTPGFLSNPVEIG